MKTRLNVQIYGPWLALITIPLVINGLLWKGVVIPQQAKLKSWREAQRLTELKPKLKALLAESYQIRVNWATTSVVGKDSQEVMQAIQRSAGRHSVQIRETRMQGRQAQGETAKRTASSSVSELSTIPLELEVTGSFSKLARWVSDVESQSGVQIDSWTLTKSSDPSPQLTVKVTVLVGGV